MKNEEFLETFFEGVRVPDAKGIAELYRECPAEFRQASNPWNKLAASIRIGQGVSALGWKYRSDDQDVINKQTARFMAATAVTHLDNSPEMQRMQDAVVAHLLEEMLLVLPTYATFPKDN